MVNLQTSVNRGFSISSWTSYLNAFSSKRTFRAGEMQPRTQSLRTPWPAVGKQVAVIGGFRGGAEGAEGAAAPPIFLYFQNVSRFCFENYLIKCSLILSSETLTLLYFASRIRPQCCMLHVLKNELFIRGGGRVGDSAPLSEFSGSAPEVYTIF